MVKRITTACSLLLSLAATIPATAQKKEKASAAATKPAPKFLDAIEIQAGEAEPEKNIITVDSRPAVSAPSVKAEVATYNSGVIESASPIQLKYAVLLNTEVE